MAGNNDYDKGTHTCSNWKRRPLFIAGFVAFELQHAVGKSLVDISSELTDRIELTSVAGPLRIFKSFWFCIEPGGGSLPGLHFPFHMFFCFCFLRLNIFTLSMVPDFLSTWWTLTIPDARTLKTVIQNKAKQKNKFQHQISVSLNFGLNCFAIFYVRFSEYPVFSG